MLKEARKPLNVLRSFTASLFLGLGTAILTVSTLALVFALLHFLLPTVASTLASFISAATAWVGLNIEVFPDQIDRVLTLSLRFILLGTVGAAFVFLLSPPKRLISWGASEDFSSASFREMKYSRLLDILYILLLLAGAANYFLYRSDGINVGDLFNRVIDAAVFGLIHSVLIFPSIIFWRYGSRLAYPLLEPKTEV